MAGLEVKVDPRGMKAANSFYGDFDYETLNGGRPENDYRNPFEVDRDRIVFSYAFRRLQSKTQVFQSGEFDFYRTRLTHSIEVARIGRSICKALAVLSPRLNDDFYIDPDLTEGVCLAHDLGHPPFGHIGERTLNRLMVDNGGFEGNGQTLRIVTELIWDRPGQNRGMSPTRAFVDGIMKYKALYREKAEEGGHPDNHFIYNEQAPIRAFALGSELVPDELVGISNINGIRSIECQIMDWADDAAYSLNDIVDGVEARYITIGSIERWAERENLRSTESKCLVALQRAIREGLVERKINAKVGDFIRACKLVESDGIFADRSNRYAFKLEVDPLCLEEALLYKRLATGLIFRSQQLEQLEFKGRRVIRQLFEALVDNYSEGGERLKVVPDREHQNILRVSSQGELTRLVCDFISGLTDGQCVRYHRKWFDPSFSSVFEIE